MLAPLLFWSLLILPRPDAPIIAADSSRAVSLVNYAFVGLPSDSGPTSVRNERWTIRNNGRALHQLLMLRLRDSTSLHTVDSWIARGAPELLPPAPLVLNVSALLPGEAVTRRILLEPGVYVVLCFVPAGRGSDGEIVDHAHLGMRRTFVVRQ